MLLKHLTARTANLALVKSKNQGCVRYFIIKSLHYKCVLSCTRKDKMDLTD